MLKRIENIKAEDSIDQGTTETKVYHFKCNFRDQTFHSENMLRKHMNMKYTINQSLNKDETVQNYEPMELAFSPKYPCPQNV